MLLTDPSCFFPSFFLSHFYSLPPSLSLSPVLLNSPFLCSSFPFFLLPFVISIPPCSLLSSSFSLSSHLILASSIPSHFLLLILSSSRPSRSLPSFPLQTNSSKFTPSSPLSSPPSPLVLAANSPCAHHTKANCPQQMYKVSRPIRGVRSP